MLECLRNKGSMARNGGHLNPPCATSKIGHHSINCQSVDLRVIPTATITGLSASTFPEKLNQLLIRSHIILSSIVDALIILNPQSNIPSLPIRPTIESAIAGMIGDERLNGHRVRFVWYEPSMAANRGNLKGSCATSPTGTGSAEFV